MLNSRVLRRTALAAALGLGAGTANAASFLFSGNFTQDDDVALHEFTVGASSYVTIVSFSYAGGTDSSGAEWLGGGFDPVLALYNNATGAKVGDIHDGAPPTAPVNVDGTSNAALDEWFQELLEPGTYTVVISQADNYPGLSLATAASDATRAGQGDFTPTVHSCGSAGSGNFWDFTCSGQRSNAYVFEVQDVNAAAPVPVPAALPLLAAGLAGFGRFRRKN